MFRIRPLALITTVAALAIAAPAARAQHAGHHPAPPAHAGHAAGHAGGEHTSGWKQLDAYHAVMMGVWHPAKEKSDLAPIRARAAELATSADSLSRAAIPNACATPANREGVAKIVSESRALAALVKTGKDAEVMTSLRALHDRFETVNKACKVPTPR